MQKDGRHDTRRHDSLESIASPSLRVVPGRKRAGSRGVAAGGRTVDFPGLDACIEDVEAAMTASHHAGTLDLPLENLIGGLKKARNKWPRPYRLQVIDPFMKTMTDWKEAGGENPLGDPNRSGALVRDVSQAILQHAGNPGDKALNAFLEVVWDLYAGFFDPMDRETILPPRYNPLPPLPRFGNFEAPRTWTVKDTNGLGVQTGIVCLPEGTKERGLLAWAVLAHEVCGHDFLDAHLGLKRELEEKVTARIQGSGIDPHLANYWSVRIEEAASDVLGILDLGPAAAIATIGFLRSMSHEGGHKLDNQILSASARYPAEILRGYLGAATVGLLPFAGASSWADSLEKELQGDSAGMTMDGKPVDLAAIKESAKIVAEAICSTPLQSLQNRALKEIQTWNDKEDEAVVLQLMTHLENQPDKVVPHIPKDWYPAHIVAAAVVASVTKNVSPKTAFGWMILNLDRMHKENKTWGLKYGHLVLGSGSIRTPWSHE